MSRRVLASFLSVLAVAALGVATSCWISLHTVLDSDRVAAVADTVLTQPAVSNQMINWIDDAVAKSVPPETGLDPATRRAIVADAYADPAARQSLSGVMVGIHRLVVTGERQDLDVVDTTGLRVALTSSATKIAPQFAPLIAVPEATISIPTDEIPKYALRDPVNRIFNLSALVALLCLGGAFALHPRRDRILSRLGKWALFTGAFYYVLLKFVPAWVTEQIDADNPARIALALVAALGATVVTTAVTLMTAGVAMLVGAWIWKHTVRDAQKYADADPKTPRVGVAPAAAAPTMAQPVYVPGATGAPVGYAPTQPGLSVTTDVYGRQSGAAGYAPTGPQIVAPPPNFFAGTEPTPAVDSYSAYRDQPLPQPEAYLDQPPTPRHAADGEN